jgi:hypothetical protein
MDRKIEITASYKIVEHEYDDGKEVAYRFLLPKGPVFFSSWDNFVNALDNNYEVQPWIPV